MKVSNIELTLVELQDALRRYVVDQLDIDLDLPDSVTVVSHGKIIHVELEAGGVIEADEFRHRAAHGIKGVA